MLEMPDDKIAVIAIFDPDKSESGRLWIPEVAKERCDQGIVKYVGPNVKNVKPGDYVLFSGYTGQALYIEGEGTLIIFREEFAVAVIVDDKAWNTDIPGLYFKGTDGKYFTATYEFALELITRAIEEAPWRRTFKSVDMLDHRPKEAATRK